MARLLELGGIATGMAGGVVAGGIRQMAEGKRPALADLLLTPANAGRLTEGLSRMRGAALKVGQMLSMDTGLVLSPELTAILTALRDDARHMPHAQLQKVLNGAWGKGWQSRFRRFDPRPIAAASIGQVHRAETLDGEHLAIKVQYPGVRESIDSDLDNVATLLRMPGLLPRGLDITPLLSEARQQLHDEADYCREAGHLQHFGMLLAGADAFRVPTYNKEFSSPSVLAMGFVESRPLESLVHATQAKRDEVARALIDLVLRELFDFGTMQTDPNLANYRMDRVAGAIVLLDFGAVRSIPGDLQAAFRRLLNAGLEGQGEEIHRAMLEIGYFSPKTTRRHQDLIQEMFVMAMEPLRQAEPFDFGSSDLLERLRNKGLAIGNERDLLHVPPASTLFLHRKIGGMYLMAAKLKARVPLRDLVEPYR
ncbi:AarF/ABC1/UbiB kinase family protein [Peteryoungia desertarenae]|uniref:ABC1 kinase family protein n=1 Tax=Peteryoungia desertarenae TaxID=1813451 RepID=UPI0031B5B717